MLFLKRLSDLFDQERESLAKELKAKGMATPTIAKQLDNPDKYTFFVPLEARWAKVQDLKTNVGTSLNKTLEALEDANVDALQDAATIWITRRRSGTEVDKVLPQFRERKEWLRKYGAGLDI